MGLFVASHPLNLCASLSLTYIVQFQLLPNADQYSFVLSSSLSFRIWIQRLLSFGGRYHLRSYGYMSAEVVIGANECISYPSTEHVDLFPVVIMEARMRFVLLPCVGNNSNMVTCVPPITSFFLFAGRQNMLIVSFLKMVTKKTRERSILICAVILGRFFMIHEYVIAHLYL